MAKSPRTDTVNAAEVLRTIDARVAGADEARLDRLTALEAVSRVRGAALEREVERLTAKHGANAGLVAETEARLQSARATVCGLVAEIDRVSQDVPQADPQAWTVHGLVLQSDRKPARDARVLIADSKGKPLGPEAVTDAKGAFAISAPVADRKGDKAGDKAAEGDAGGSVHLEVFRASKRMAVDTLEFHPAAGVVDYREILVGSTTRVPR